MNTRTAGWIVAAVGSALVLVACKSLSNGQVGLPVVGPNGLSVQPVSAPKIDMSLLTLSQESTVGMVMLPSRVIRGEDEATPALANLIIAKAQANIRVKERALLSKQNYLEHADHCHGMDD